jgi:hypothetical protein
MSRGMRGIIIGLIFEDCECGAQHLVDDSTDHGHLAQAALSQAVGEGLESGVVFDGHKGWEVESLAQVAISPGSDARGFFDGAALRDARSHASPGGGGAGVFKVAWQFGHQGTGGLCADPRDGLKAQAIGCQTRRGLDQLSGRSFQTREFLLQPADMGAEASSGGALLAGGFDPVALGLEHGAQFLAAAQEFTELRLRFGRREPLRQLVVGLSKAEACDNLGIDLVGLVVPALALGVEMDPVGTEHTDPVARLMEQVGSQFAIGAGRFHEGGDRLGMMSFEPLEERLEPRVAVGEGAAVTMPGGGVTEQANFQGGLGDIDAKAGFEFVRWSGHGHGLDVVWMTPLKRSPAIGTGLSAHCRRV